MKKSSVLLASAVLVATGASLGFYCPFTAGERVMKLHGTVEIQEVRLSSKVGGRVKKVAVADGELVKPGQALVFFDCPEMEAQRDQLEAKLRAAQAARMRTYNGSRPEEKAVAKAGVEAAKARLSKLVAGTRPEEIEKARHELASAKADFDRAERDWEREKVLYPAATSKAAYDQALAARLRGEGALNAARANLKMLEAGARAEEIAEASAELERARANLDMIVAGSRAEDLLEADARVAELQGKLREIEAQLKEAVVVAPEPALVEVVAVRPGDVVGPNQTVIRVLRAEDLWVKSYVSEVDLGKVHLNDVVEITVDSHSGARFQGKIIWIASVSEFTPRNVQSIDERRNQVFAVKIRVADPHGVLKSGMAADVTVTLR
jgi:HlyD family secretion protein